MAGKLRRGNPNRGVVCDFGALTRASPKHSAALARGFGRAARATVDETRNAGGRRQRRKNRGAGSDFLRGNRGVGRNFVARVERRPKRAKAEKKSKSEKR